MFFFFFFFFGRMNSDPLKQAAQFSSSPDGLYCLLSRFGRREGGGGRGILWYLLAGIHERLLQRRELVKQ